MWRAIGEYWSDNPIYKIGVTSHRLGKQRIERVAKAHGFEYEIIFMRNTHRALQIETKLLNKYTDVPKLEKVDGFNEFRAIKDLV